MSRPADSAAWFSGDYATARARFRTAALAAGGVTEAHPIAATGPHGSELTVDVARFGPEDADRLLIVSSGLHGVEGFFGSAAQLAWVDGGFGGRGPAAGEAVLFLHGLDPYGFAWVRRWDEGNVDLNRNFLLDGEEYAGSPPVYREIDRLLNPRHGPKRLGRLSFTLRAYLAALVHGWAGLKQAVAQGQYEFPFGLFYGGHGPAPVHTIVATNLDRWVGRARTVVHVDFHTGLGRRGDHVLLVAPGQPAQAVERLRRAFPGSRVESNDPKGTAYETRGDLGVWCGRRLEGRDYAYLCAEFGTYPALHVLAALRAENQAHHWLPPGHRARDGVKLDLMEAFVPADSRWRNRTVADALALLDQARNLAFAVEPGGR